MNALDALGVLIVTELPTFHVPLVVGVVALAMESRVTDCDPLAGA